MRLSRPLRTAALSAVLVASLGGCGGPESMIVSGVVSAALRTAIEQAEKNRPTPEQLWHEAQVASVEQQALNGNVEAQFQIGIYYLLRQEPVAERWICEAASRGHAKAQLQYGHLYNEDRIRDDLFPFIPVAPDNRTAYLWYSLAAHHGEPRAQHFRDSLALAGLPEPLLRDVNARVTSWQPGPCGSTVPVTPPRQRPGLTTVADSRAAP